ncbi:MAG: phosphoribosylaminoimidazolesuccinocarboxamide synthase [Rhodospirillales bacterium]|nr:phosphoribosylaminoimidazolesuccinocarboxamide synthase [Rhodospirillales bacterium]MCB9965596.1 phosphoribosylaminoimidazolesuccinocarboxamide synthase [Rhodospirillales bacterium]
MARRKMLYDGKAKTIFEGPEPGTIIQYFKDDASADNGAKHAVLPGKGVLNNRISAYIMTRLESMGIPTHFLKSINMREQLVREVEVVPLEVVIRNAAAGSLAKRLNIKEGTILPRPIVEFYLKNKELGNPLVTEDHIFAFGWADPLELEEMMAMSWRINDYLSGLFAGINLRLVDFKLEFGRLYGDMGELYLLLADEISPDNCRLWDLDTNEKMDKDRFREDLGGLVEAYQQVAERLGLIPKGGIIEGGNINEQIAAGLDEIENELSRQRRLRGINRNAPNKGPRKI